MKGAEVLIDCLIKEGVEHIFGIPGGAVIDICDLMNRSSLKFILTRHEQGAAHAADGYARSTGKVGVCFATSGPGATNLVTGIATAYMDSVPIVAITGQVPTPMIGNDAFQEADTTGITRPVTKHNYLVRNVDELPSVIREAFHIALTGRPGPVLIDIPKDVQQKSTSSRYPSSLDLPGYKPTRKGHFKQIEKVAGAIKNSKKPLIYAGGGVIISGASKELLELVQKARIPVTTTLMALGAFPETDELSLKMLGMHGTRYANMAVTETDLLIAIGARFDDRITGKLSEFAPHAKIVHIDIDPSSISKNVTVHIPVVGDAREVLLELNKIVEKADSDEWLEQIKEWKQQYPLTYQQGKGGRIKPQQVVEEIYRATEGKAIICTEVGQNQMWAAQFYKYTIPRQFLTSGGLGTMGYGFPAAIGAQVGNPDKLVFDIAGDGSIQMNIQELATAVINGLPVKVAILNNQYLGMVRQWQGLFYDKNYAYTSLARNVEPAEEGNGPREMETTYIPDFVKVAEAYGAVGMRIERPQDVREAIEEAIRIPKTVVMDFRVEKEENVWPMVPAGAAISEMIDGVELL
ncbi:biosynthetic-type acetolactate synthase large subunit [bacterium]|nr:biosynthetic-type acetolactate synthase large subunit [bacterium]